MNVRFKDFSGVKTTFTDGMMDLFDRSTTELSKELEANKDYSEARNAYQKLYEEVENSLPDGKKDLVSELFDAGHEEKLIFLEAMFIKGLRCGFEMAKLMGVIEE